MALNLRVASPCSADWEEMVGDDRVRYCSQCRLNVYNFAAMSEREVKELVATHEGRLCGRLYRRADGTMLTRDCPVGFRAVVRRVSRVAGAALTAAMSLVPALAQTAKDKTSLVQIEKSNVNFSVVVTDGLGAAIEHAQVTLISTQKRTAWSGATDRYGHFSASGGLPVGTYLMRVEGANFRTFSQTVELSKSTVLTVHMELGDPQMGIIVEPEVNLVPEEIPNAVPDRLDEPNPSRLNLKKLISPFHHS
jgi:hypothetical protein